jgi:hypothetical protein
MQSAKSSKYLLTPPKSKSLRTGRIERVGGGGRRGRGNGGPKKTNSRPVKAEGQAAIASVKCTQHQEYSEDKEGLAEW